MSDHETLYFIAGLLAINWLATCAILSMTLTLFKDRARPEAKP